ncbi:MAG: hypothetical protein JNM25_11440 [Planctomycetes bacterium]|nr:hypothetical protein [Planctomycetota bacterium]
MVGQRPLLPLLRDALLVAGIAVLTVQALRRWAGDRYMVPSDSMQPVLHGDPEHGDVVFVDKLARAAARRRHDLVVVRHPDQPGQQLVKRIAARGDDADACWIDIREGDVWLGANAQVLQREHKDPFAAKAMRVAWAAWPATAALVAPLDLAAATPGARALELPPLREDLAAARALFGAAQRALRRGDRSPGVLPVGCIGTSRAVDASCVDGTGTRGRAGEDVGVLDCGMELDVAAPVDALLVTLDGRHRALTLCWRARSGEVELWDDGVVAERAELPHRPAGAHRIEFGLLDDRVFFAVDGRRDALLVWARPAPTASERSDPPRMHVHVGVLGAETLRLTRLQVFRDVFYWRERIAGFPGDRGQWPRFVPPGCWFLLGDNTFDSRDSRHFDAVPAASFLGVPRLILGPWPRARWLP